MDFFITRCPECHTAYKTTPAQLETAKGRLRCGECGAVFTASDNRQETPSEKDTLTELAADEPTPARRGKRRQRNFLLQLLATGGRNTLPRSIQITAVVVLCTTLLLQYLWHNRLVLAQDPDRRNWAELTCGLLPCQLAPLQQLDLLHGENLIIRSHPEQGDALLLSLSIHNTADFDQPFPALALIFRGLDSSPVAAARFEPGQYLAQALHDHHLLPAGTSVQIQLALEDPGEHALNYEIDLLPGNSGSNH